MADLLSHIALGHIAKRLSPWPQGALMFAVGSALPDVVGRVPRIVLRMADPTGEVAIPPMLFDVWSALHLPVPFVVLCVFIALLAPEAARTPLFRNLAAGGLGHFCVDFLQTHIDPGIYKYLWPLSFQGMELGWVGTETSLLWLPVLIPAALAVEVWARQKRGSSGGIRPSAAEQGAAATGGMGPSSAGQMDAGEVAQAEEGRASGRQEALSRPGTSGRPADQ